MNHIILAGRGPPTARAFGPGGSLMLGGRRPGQSPEPAPASSTGGGSKPSMARKTMTGSPLVALDVDDDRLAGPELLPQDLLRQRILDQALQRPAQRPGPERRVVTLARPRSTWPPGSAPGRGPGSPSWSRSRLIIRSMISVTSSLVSSWKTMVSSIRLRNSGRKWALRASLTLSFIFS